MSNDAHCDVPPSASAPSPRRLRALVALLLAITAAYANHFGNAFHFDDFHAIVDNPAIRNLGNVGRFFSDGRTFSVLVENQGWRPWVSTTLAFDYYLGGGYQPFWFHMSTFLAFLGLVGALYALCAHLYDLARPSDARNRAAALFTAAVFGLHPVGAETVNYIIQRADLYVTLGLVAGVALYATRPSQRRYGLYLAPFLMAAMAKPTALVFPLLLLAYTGLFETSATWRTRGESLLPAFAAILGLALVHHAMTPPTYIYGGADPYGYRITQPYIALHYVRSFFWPTALSADTDMEAAHSLLEPWVMLGFGFVTSLVAVAVRCARQPRLRPVSFGLVWFLITLLPTSLAPLAEVTNDHRMFLPFAGLAIAVCWAATLAVSAWPAPRARAAALLVLVVLGVSTHIRNRAWATEQSLWADVVVKSPRNGRGWMNYGLTFMQSGDFSRALACFDEAARLTPNYDYLEINLGVAHGQLPGHEREAEQHFQRALLLDKRSARPHYFYGRWLRQQRRADEALALLRDGMRRAPSDLRVRHLAMEILAEIYDWTALNALAVETMQLAPDDTVAASFVYVTRDEPTRAVAVAEKAVAEHPTAEGYLQLSLEYHRANRYHEAIAAARKALALRPGYAEAWNNVSAACLGLEDWDGAIAAADRALALKPGMALARNNKAYAQARRGGSVRALPSP